MSESITLFDPEELAQRRRERRWIFVALVIGVIIFAYPIVGEQAPTRRELETARKLAGFFLTLRGQAIAKKTPYEARIFPPARIEVSEVEHCGPGAKAVKQYETSLESFVPDVVFAPEKFIEENKDLLERVPPLLNRYCYDPLYGSSISADGLAFGAIFLVHKKHLQEQNTDRLVRVEVRSASGDVTVE